MESGNPLMQELLESWEEQQNCHIRFREDRFRIMFDFVDQACTGEKNALDIACGPGSLSRRFLNRFPGATITSVDYDPVLLHIGKNTPVDTSNRINWIEGDLRRSDWSSDLRSESYDCAMSTTAVHWLSESEVTGLYRSIYSLLKKGGVFLNGDHLISEIRDKAFAEHVHRGKEKWSEEAFRISGAKDWDQWWNHVRGMDYFRELISERTKRYSSPDNHNQMVSLQTHVAHLKSAGFNRIDVIWQYGNDRILAAMK